MKRFNLALQPININLQNLFADLSQKYFGMVHDDYILGKDGLAHVTLCQFYAEDDAAALEAFQTFYYKSDIELVIKTFRLRPGTNDNSDKYMAEILIEKSPELLERQKTCFEHLEAKGIEPLTLPETYSPHITLARLTKPMTPPSDLELSVPAFEKAPFRLVVGTATHSGVLTKILS